MLATDDDPDAGGKALAGGDLGSVLAALVEDDLPPTAGSDADADADAVSSALGATIAVSGLAAESPSALALTTPLAAES